MYKHCIVGFVAVIGLCHSTQADIKCVLDYTSNSSARGGGSLYSLEVSPGTETDTYVAKFTVRENNETVLNRENITYDMPCRSGAIRNKAQLVDCSNLNVYPLEFPRRDHIYEGIYNKEVNEAKLSGADEKGNAILVQSEEFRFQISSELLAEKKFEILQPTIKKILDTKVGTIEINFSKEDPFILTIIEDTNVQTTVI